MNHACGLAGDAPDLLTPVLYIKRGVPQSIYTMWHSDDAEGTTYIAYGGDAEIFNAERERKRAAAA